MLEVQVWARRKVNARMCEDKSFLMGAEHIVDFRKSFFQLKAQSSSTRESKIHFCAIRPLYGFRGFDRLVSSQFLKTPCCISTSARGRNPRAR